MACAHSAPGCVDLGLLWCLSIYSQLAFKAHTQAVALVLKLASDTVEAHISYLKVTKRACKGLHNRMCV